jgi:hypothetical protein
MRRGAPVAATCDFDKGRKRPANRDAPDIARRDSNGPFASPGLPDREKCFYFLRVEGPGAPGRRGIERAICIPAAS